MITKKLRFVTSASKSLGLTLMRQRLAAGYAVASTSRHLAELQNAGPAAPEQRRPTRPAAVAGGSFAVEAQ